MKKLSLIFVATGLISLEFRDTALGQGYFPPGTSLPPRGYILPPSNAPMRQAPPPQYRPMPSAPAQNVAPRYPRPEPTAQVRKSTSTASSTTKKKPTPEVAKSTKATKNSTSTKQASVAKTDTKKPTTSSKAVATAPTKKAKLSDTPAKVASVKQSISEVKSTLRTVKAEAKQTLGELARDLHTPAKNATAPNQSVAGVSTTKSPAASFNANITPPLQTMVAAQVPTISVNANPVQEASVAAAANPPAIITMAENLPSRVIGSRAMLPLAMPAEPTPAPVPTLSATDANLKDVVTAAPKAHVLNSLPLDELPPTEEDLPKEPAKMALATSTGTSFPNPPEPPVLVSPVEETPKEPKPSKVVAAEIPDDTNTAPNVLLPPIVKPSLASVRNATFKSAASTAAPSPTVIEESSDFIPGGSTFDEPMTSKPATTAPAFALNPSLGTLTIDAERADSESGKNVVTFNGNVNISCKRFVMKADKVISNLRDPEKGGGVEKVVGYGNVTVKMLSAEGQGYTASGNQAIYDPTSETIRLTGWPKIEEGKTALVATSPSTEILIDTKTSRLNTTGSTKTVLRQ